MKILVAEDATINREILREMLEQEYELQMAHDGAQALQMLEAQAHDIDAVLLDLNMPRVNGYAVLDEMKKREWIDNIPVLIISGETEPKAEQYCLEMGAADFIHRPFVPSIVKNRIRNSIYLYSYKNKLEEKVAEQTETMRKQCVLLKRQAEEMKKSSDKLVEILATVVENRNLEGGEHIRRVKGFTRIMAMKMMEMYPEYGLDVKRIDAIASASTLHDVGKIAITDKILLKPGKLTPEEFDYMKSHTTRGGEIINSIEDVWNDDFRTLCYEICRHHHERYDGRGYPDALKGDEIPISAQIVSVADVYDALICERVYKAAIPKDKAFWMICNGECGVFSPKLIECFRSARKEMEKLADEIC